MVSLAALATRNLTTVLALILMVSPVWGLRPMRAFRSAFTNRPSPGMTNTPFFFVSFTAVSASRSRKAADCLLVNSSFSAICRTSAVLVRVVAIGKILLCHLALDFVAPRANQGRRCDVLTKAQCLRCFQRAYALNHAILRNFCQWQKSAFHRFS